MPMKSPKNFGGLIAVLIPISLITWAWALPLSSIDHEHVGLRNKTTGIIDGLWKCNKCEPGSGQSVPCGGIVDIGTVIECVPCKEGETFSDTRDIGQCKFCRICPSFEKKTGKCSVDQDTTQCFCKPGFYRHEVTRACTPCSWCCDDHKTNHVISECKGNPQGKHCSFQDRKDCAPTSKPTNSTDTITSVSVIITPTTKHEVLPSEKEKKDTPDYMDKERSNNTKKIQGKDSGLPSLSIALLIALSACVFAIVGVILVPIAYRGRQSSSSPTVQYDGENVHFLSGNSAETGAARSCEDAQPTVNEKKSVICQKFGPKIEDFMCHDVKHEVCLMLNVRQPQTNDYYERVAYKAGMKFHQVKNLSHVNPMEDVFTAMIGEARTLEYFVDILNEIGRVDVVNKMYNMALK